MRVRTLESPNCWDFVGTHLHGADDLWSTQSYHLKEAMGTKGVSQTASEHAIEKGKLPVPSPCTLPATLVRSFVSPFWQAAPFPFGKLARVCAGLIWVWVWSGLVWFGSLVTAVPRPNGEPQRTRNANPKAEPRSRGPRPERACGMGYPAPSTRGLARVEGRTQTLVARGG